MKRILLILFLAFTMAIAFSANAYEIADEFHGLIWTGEVSSDAFYGPSPPVDYIADMIIEKCGSTYSMSYEPTTCNSQGQKPCEAHINGLLGGKPIQVNLIGNGHDFIFDVLFLPKKSLTVKQATNKGAKLVQCVKDAILSIDY